MIQWLSWFYHDFNQIVNFYKIVAFDLLKYLQLYVNEYDREI